MFDVGAYRFKAHPQTNVLRMCPYIRTNEEEEQSAYAMLLLYVPWPKGGKDNLLRGHDTAVAAFEELKCTDQLPISVLTQIATFTKSDEILNDLGNIEHPDQNELPPKDDESSDSEDSNLNDMDFLMDDDVLSDAAAAAEDNEVKSVGMSDSEGSNYNVATAGRNSTDVQVITKEQTKFLSTFVSNECAKYMNKYTEDNSSNNIYTTTSTSNSSSSNAESEPMSARIPLKNETERRKVLKERIARFTPDQKRALDVLLSCIHNPDVDTLESMIQLVTGGAGVGKSEYVKCAVETLRLHYGKQPGIYGSVLIMGPTGCASHHINGFTWQSVCLKGYEESSSYRHSYLSQDKAEILYNQIRGVKLIVIDEVSMISLESLYEISTRICEAICTSIADPQQRKLVRNKPFAGINTILCGDLYQLGCVGGTPIYATSPQNICAVRGQAIWRQIKAYLNFITSTRYAHTSEDKTSQFEVFLNGARVANPASRSISLLNTHVCMNYMDAYNKAHRNALWLTSTHAAKDPINKFMYERLQAEGAYTMDVLAKHSRNDCPQSHMTRKEKDRYYARGGKVPVLLRLAIGSRVKITKNIAA